MKRPGARPLADNRAVSADGRSIVRALRFLSWMALPVTVVLTLGGIYLSILNRDVPGTAGVVVYAILDLVLLGFVALGILVVHRRPGNPVGWIISGVGVTAVASGFLESYGVYALFTEPGRFSGGETTAWLSTLIFIPVLFAAPAMLFLLFPNGNLPGRRWRVVFWLVILTTCSTVAGAGLNPVLNDAPFKGVANTLGVDPLRAFRNPLQHRMAGDDREVPRGGLRHDLAPAPIPGRGEAAVEVDRRGRRGPTPRERCGGLQLLSGIRDGRKSPRHLLLRSHTLCGGLRCPSLPPLPHRHYHQPALVYGVLTISLVLVYVGGVVSLQYVFRTLTGGGSQLAVVASTLAIAALFNPLRRRVQNLIDRRLYRRKYDAQKTLSAFSKTLREETDLEALNAELLSVVGATMLPKHASLWLMPADGKVKR